MLVLSLFPGIGLLDRAFEEEGFTVLRGPDALWGGDVRRFHPPAAVFQGVIGGPPCQVFSQLAKLNRAQGKEPRYGNLIPEFERCVSEAVPEWFLMENVPQAPLPVVDGYTVQPFLLNNRWLGEEQQRLRRLSFGSPAGLRLDISADLVPLESPIQVRAVTSANGFALNGAEYYEAVRRQAVTSAHGGEGRQKKQVRYTVAEATRLQGLPAGFLEDAPFTEEGKRRVIANGVPLPMGRAIARAVKRAVGSQPALNPVRNSVG